MKSFQLSLSLFAAAAAAACVLRFGNTSDAAGGANVAHGDYIVHRVALCVECHGATLRGGHASGTPGRLGPAAPPIAGLPMFQSDERAVRFLSTGIDATGRFAPPPMPAFRFNDGDARDIVAYLRSVK